MIRQHQTNLALLDISVLREEAFIRAMEAYKSKNERYDGKVVLMKAQDLSSWGNGVSFEPDYGWSQYIDGELVVKEIPGGHLTIIEQPNVVKLVSALSPYLK
jgi:thioesterase domain-containing protein